MENLKEMLEINTNKDLCSLNKIGTNENIESLRVHCGASDSYFEDM